MTFNYKDSRHYNMDGSYHVVNDDLYEGFTYGGMHFVNRKSEPVFSESQINLQRRFNKVFNRFVAPLIGISIVLMFII